MTLGIGRASGRVRTAATSTSQRGMPSRTVAGIGGTGFTPLHLPGLQLWLDASDTSTITSSSGAVSQWNDKSGLGRNFSQSTAASQPTTGATTQNGLNVVDFSTTGTIDWLGNGTASNFTFLHDGTPHVIAIAAKITNAQGMYLGNMQGNNNNRGVYLYKNNALFQHLVMPGSALTVVINNNPGSVLDTAAKVVTVLATPGDATAASRSSLYVNGGAANSVNTQTATPSTSAPSFNMTLGAARLDASNVGFAMNGWIAEVVMATGITADANARIALLDYLNAKWAVY